MMSAEKFYDISEYHAKITKQQLNVRVKRAIKRHIRQTDYFDLMKNGTYVKVISAVTGKRPCTIVSYLSEYDKSGIYKYKFTLILLCRIAETFNVSLEYLLNKTEKDFPTTTAREYIELYEKYESTSKLVVAENVRIFKGVNGIETNKDIGNVLGISDNAVKANISTGVKAKSNMFTIEQLYKLADAFDIEIDKFFRTSEERNAAMIQNGN